MSDLKDLNASEIEVNLLLTHSTLYDCSIMNLRGCMIVPAVTPLASTAHLDLTQYC